VLSSSDTVGDVAVELPGAGVWFFQDATGWRQLTGGNASSPGASR
jgi:hypothetical protein